MKIKMETIREISPNDYWDWVRELNKYGVPIDGLKLLHDNEWIFETNFEHDKVKTTYTIMEK